MKLRIKNLGVVTSAEIDLAKDLTIFCGPNGTGKTYVGYLINAIFSRNSEVSFQFDEDLVTALFNDNRIEIGLEHIRRWAKQVSDRLKSLLPSIYGISVSESSKMFASTEIDLSIEESDYQTFIEGEAKYFLFQNANDEMTSKVEMAYKNQGEASIALSGWWSKEDVLSVSDSFSRVCSMFFKSILLSKRNARMLTVERNSIYTFKTELLANRLETVDKVLISEYKDGEEIVRRRATLYPLAVRNSLRIASELPEVRKHETDYVKLADEIESVILGGEVVVDKDGDVIFQPKGGTRICPLPIRMSSSAVKTMSGLVIYLRHLAKDGDLLIIDEPEMNLHPDNQRRLARIFARMINRGIRLLISTHSDYIIREFNNLIMFWTLYQKYESKPVDMYDRDAIDRHRSQALLFDFDETAFVKVVPISIDNFGIEVKTIDRTIEDQNEQTIILRDTLQECLSDEGI